MDFFQSVAIFEFILSTQLQLDPSALVAASFTDDNGTFEQNSKVRYFDGGRHIRWEGSSPVEAFSRDFKFLYGDSGRAVALQMTDWSSFQPEFITQVDHDFTYEEGRLAQVQGESNLGYRFNYDYEYVDGLLAAVTYKEFDGATATQWQQAFIRDSTGKIAKIFQGERRWSVQYDSTGRIVGIDILDPVTGPVQNRLYEYQGENLSRVALEIYKDGVKSGSLERRYTYAALEDLLEQTPPLSIARGRLIAPRHSGSSGRPGGNHTLRPLAGVRDVMGRVSLPRRTSGVLILPLRP